MNRKINDIVLPILAIGCCAAAIIALRRYHALAFPSKQFVFASLFLSPALLLHGFLQILRRKATFPILVSLVFAAIGVAVWGYAVHGWLTMQGHS